MNAIIRTGQPRRRIVARVLGLVAVAALAIGTISAASPAFAQHRHWHGRRACSRPRHVGGGYYGSPPVVYGGYAPGYYYGPDYYAPPPVVYGAPGSASASTCPASASASGFRD